jgi:hypothetical protein
MSETEVEPAYLDLEGGQHERLKYIIYITNVVAICTCLTVLA